MFSIKPIELDRLERAVALAVCVPVLVPRQRAGPAMLSWKGVNGKAHTQRVIVFKKLVSFELAE